jgi:hypothetical protein
MKDERYARKLGGPSANDACLRAVGVYNLGAFFSEEAPKFDYGENVLKRSDFPHHGRDPDAAQIGNAIRPIDKQTFRARSEPDFITISREAFQCHECHFLCAA